MTDADIAEIRARMKATKEWREFLQSSPAYIERRFEQLRVDTPTVGTSIVSPRIQLYCQQDDGYRSFDCTSGNIFVGQDDTTNVVVYYTCRDCGNWRKTFALTIVVDKKVPSTVTAMKLGEYPPYGSHIAKRLQSMLPSDDLELYRKGLRSEREGHGIGAAAYFRRVVENQWRTLVKKLRDAAQKTGTPPERLLVFDDALAQQQFSVAVEMLRDAIPPKLLILDGRNPLTLLYRPLSVQIHDMSDEDCLQQAADIRLVLNELFDNISRVLTDDEALRGAVTRLQGP